ncbi:MAG TPA: type II toxin-antitoxin system RelE/ParE family toxin [Candidatus Angelobacter sp.]
MKYRVSKDAEQDLEEIFLYWAKRAGVDVADRLIDSITERFWLLADYSGIGRAVDNIAPGVRCFPAGKYLIYYRKTRSRTEILHVFHGARDQARAYRQSSHHQ